MSMYIASPIVSEFFKCFWQGLERNVNVDLNLVNNLRTLDAFVYEVQVDIDLQTFEKLSTLEQIRYLLSNSRDLVHSIRSLLVPFLYRMDDLRPGDFYKVLYQFCLNEAQTDLLVALTIVENSRLGVPGVILTDPAQIVRLAIDSCYAHEKGVVYTRKRWYMHQNGRLYAPEWNAITNGLLY